MAGPESCFALRVFLQAAGPAYADECFVGIGEGEFVHPPWFVFGFVLDEWAEECGEGVDLFGVEVEAEGIAAADEPAVDGVGEVKTAAASVGEDAIVVFRVLSFEAELGVEGGTGVEVVAGKNCGEAAGVADHVHPGIGWAPGLLTRHGGRRCGGL